MIRFKAENFIRIFFASNMLTDLEYTELTLWQIWTIWGRTDEMSVKTTLLPCSFTWKKKKFIKCIKRIFSN